MSAYNLFSASAMPYAFPLVRTAVHSTIAHKFENGVEQTRPKWTRKKRRWALTFQNLNKTEMDALWDFFNNQKGRSTPFLFDDPRQSSVTAEAVGTGDGATTIFALANRYVTASTLVVKLNGSTTTAFTLADDTGIITFNTAPGNGVAITADYRSTVLVRFVSDELKEEQTAYQVFNAQADAEEVFP